MKPTQPIVSDAEGYQQREECRDKIKVRLEALTFVSVVVYAVLTYRLLRTGQRQLAAMVAANAIAQGSMRASQRPYVDIGKSKNGTATEWLTENRGNKIGLRLYFENVGSTPAKRVVVNGIRFDTDNGSVGVKPFQPPFHLAFSVRRMQGTLEVIPKRGTPQKVPLTMYGYTQGALIPSHETVPIAIANLTAEQIKELLEERKKHKIIIVGSFEYTDIFDEYCCELFRVTFGRKGLSTEVGGWAERGSVCPKDLPNICRPKSENKYVKSL